MHSNFKQLLKENGYRLKDIERGIREADRLRVFAEQGDMSSVDLIVDAERVLHNCNATDKQLATAYRYYKDGMRYHEIGKELGVTPQAVGYNLSLLKVKITEVLNEHNQIVLNQYTEDDDYDYTLDTPKIFISEGKDKK